MVDEQNAPTKGGEIAAILAQGLKSRQTAIWQNNNL